MKDETDLYLVSGLSFRNYDDIQPHTICGCYYCVSVFKGDRITEWADGEETALCPNCGIDAVIPEESNIDFLLEAHHYWFDHPTEDD